MEQGARFQLRLKLTEAFANAAKADPTGQALKPLQDILQKYEASLENILQEFRQWVDDPALEGTTDPDVRALIDVTRATLGDEAKCARWSRAYIVHMGGRAVFGQDDPAVAGLEQELAGLAASHAGMIEKTRRTYYPANGKMHGVFSPDAATGH